MRDGKEERRDDRKAMKDVERKITDVELIEIRDMSEERKDAKVEMKDVEEKNDGW